MEAWQKVIEAARFSINMRPRKMLDYLSLLGFLSGKHVSITVGTCNISALY